MSETWDDEDASRRKNLITGSLIALLTVTIWACWLVGTRYAVRSSLLPHDIAVLRFIVPAVVLAPYWLRAGLRPSGAPWFTIPYIVCGAGLPFYIAVASGLQLAPAAHGGMLLPGTMPVFVALIAFGLFGDKFGWRRGTGFLLIAVGGAGIGGWSIISDNIEGAWRGHLMFICAAFL